MEGRPNYNHWEGLGLIGAWIVLAAVLGSATGYTIKYADCTHPEGIRQYAKASLCQDPTTNLLSSDQTQAYTLVQKAHSQTVNGYACELQVSTFRAYCGIYSNVKMGQAPEIAHHVHVGREV